MSRLIVTIFVIFAGAYLVGAAERPPRTWTSDDSKFQVQAAFVGVDAGQVTLRRADGTLFDVPLNRLSTVDQEYVRSAGSIIPPPLPDAQAVAGVDRAANESVRAQDAASVFNAYFHAWPPSAGSRFAYDSSSAKWTAASAAKRLRLGREWVEAEEAKAAERAAEEFLQQALTEIAAMRGTEARTLLQKAAAANPMSATANCLTGLIYAATVRDYAQARIQFSEARTRDPLNPVVLNNLGLVELRLGNTGAAVGLWQQGLDVAPSFSALRQNIATLARRNSAGALTVPTGLDTVLRTLAAIVGEEGQPPVRAVAWAYAPPSEDSESTAYAAGFVVQPQFVLSYLPSYSAGAPIEVFAADQPMVRRAARVVRHDADSGLMLLSVTDLDAAPLTWCAEFPTEGADVRVAGFLRPTHVSDSLRFGLGSIASSPAAPASNLFVCTNSLLFEAGLSPVLDGRGRVVGATLAQHRLGQPIGFGLPASALRSFAEKDRPTEIEASADASVASTQTATASSPASWDEIEKHVRKGMVLVRRRQTPRTDLCSAAGIALEDDYCDRCRGFGLVDCPIRGCENGGILVKVPTVTGRLPSGVENIIVNKVRQPCGVCGANGKVQCQMCGGSGKFRDVPR